MASPPAVATIVVGRRGARRLRGLHPWIYRSDVVEVKASGGQIVRVRGPRGRHYGYALFSDRSKISLRMLSRDRAEPDRAFWKQRLQAAIELRSRLGLDHGPHRMVHAEADRLPSLIVDAYGEYLVVQSLSQAMDQLQPQMVEWLVELVSPKGILARNDPRVRHLEGLEQNVQLVYGEVPERVEVTLSGVVHEVDLRHGQKTGLFLDQRENLEAAARYARGRLLDCFSYQGGFALRLARQCEEVLAVEFSEAAAARLGASAKLNGLTIKVEVGNAFDSLRRLEADGQRFDTIVLDPPAFAKNKAAVVRAVAGYKEINLRALKLLNPEGILITCSCSHHLDEARFGSVLENAAVDAGVRVHVLETRRQSRDHPILLGVPETSYLKCLILRKLPEAPTGRRGKEVGVAGFEPAAPCSRCRERCRRARIPDGHGPRFRRLLALSCRATCWSTRSKAGRPHAHGRGGAGPEIQHRTARTPRSPPSPAALPLPEHRRRDHVHQSAYPYPRSRRVFAPHRPETLAEWLQVDALSAWIDGWEPFWPDLVAEPSSVCGELPSTLRSRIRALPPPKMPGLWPNKERAIKGLESSLAAVFGVVSIHPRHPQIGARNYRERPRFIRSRRFREQFSTVTVEAAYDLVSWHARWNKGGPVIADASDTLVDIDGSTFEFRIEAFSTHHAVLTYGVCRRKRPAVVAAASA